MHAGVSMCSSQVSGTILCSWWFELFLCHISQYKLVCHVMVFVLNVYSGDKPRFECSNILHIHIARYVIGSFAGRVAPSFRFHFIRSADAERPTSKIRPSHCKPASSRNSRNSLLSSYARPLEIEFRLETCVKIPSSSCYHINQLIVSCRASVCDSCALLGLACIANRIPEQLTTWVFFSSNNFPESARRISSFGERQSFELRNSSIDDEKAAFEDDSGLCWYKNRLVFGE